MRNVTLRQLRTIEAVSRLGKINLAAGELGLTGPALTLQIQQLERDTGVSLFDRTREGMVPTTFGLAFLEAAHAIEDVTAIFQAEANLDPDRAATVAQTLIFEHQQNVGALYGAVPGVLLKWASQR